MKVSVAATTAHRLSFKVLVATTTAHRISFKVLVELFQKLASALRARSGQRPAFDVFYLMFHFAPLVPKEKVAMEFSLVKSLYAD